MGISSVIALGDAAEAWSGGGGGQGKRAAEQCRNGAAAEQREQESVTGSRI
jgi:hypothetical protein